MLFFFLLILIVGFVPFWIFWLSMELWPDAGKITIIFLFI
jgi:hypothetical protein